MVTQINLNSPAQREQKQHVSRSLPNDHHYVRHLRSTLCLLARPSARARPCVRACTLVQLFHFSFMFFFFSVFLFLSFHLHKERKRHRFFFSIISFFQSLAQTCVSLFFSSIFPSFLVLVSLFFLSPSVGCSMEKSPFSFHSR